MVGLRAAIRTGMSNASVTSTGLCTRKLLLSTATAPFASVHDRDSLDFSEVFFTDVRVPSENWSARCNEGWRVANGRSAMNAR